MMYRLIMVDACTHGFSHRIVWAIFNDYFLLQNIFFSVSVKFFGFFFLSLIQTNFNSALCWWIWCFSMFTFWKSHDNKTQKKICFNFFFTLDHQRKISRGNLIFFFWFSVLLLICQHFFFLISWFKWKNFESKKKNCDVCGVCWLSVRTKVQEINVLLEFFF